MKTKYAPHRFLESTADLAPLSVTYFFEKMVFQLYRRWWYVTDLPAFVQTHGCSFGAGLGVRAGRSLAHCLRRNPQLRMVGIDPWEAPQMEARCRQAVKKFDARVRLYQGDPMTMSDHVQDASLDFIFFEEYERELSYFEWHALIIRRWLPKLKPGGLFIGLDFHDRNIQAVIREQGYRLRTCLIKDRLSVRLKYFTNDLSRTKSTILSIL